MADKFKSDDSGKNKLAKKVLLTLFLQIFIPIICVVIAIIIFFGPIFVAIGTVLEWFDSSGSNNDNGEYIVYQQNNDKYWWPIGSDETTEMDGFLFASGAPATTGITSDFGRRCYIGTHGGTICGYHYGIDIGGRGEINDVNIIAAMDGVVYMTYNDCNSYGNSEDMCGGGGKGNYIIIGHSNGSYTKYFHLTKDSLTVSIGDVVKQGQVIAKMGTSGSSTGPHLHFQVEVGGLGQSYAVDPMTYLSHDDYRPGPAITTTEDSALLMLHRLEGSGPTEGNYYIVYDDGYGTLTVGHGVTLKNHASKFSNRGVDINSLSKGSKIEMSIVDDIEGEILDNMRKNVENTISGNGLQLETYQIDALLLRIYNVGNIVGFVTNYNKYGNTQALYDNYMNAPVMSNGQYSAGLVKRRKAEWDLFHSGIYLT